MLARLLTTAEATTELRCLTELHCCLLALLPLGRYSHLRRHQTHSGPGLCSEVCLTWHPDQKTRQQPSAGSGQDNVDDRWPCHISTILIPHAVCTTLPSLGPLPPLHMPCLACRPQPSQDRQQSPPRHASHLACSAPSRASTPGSWGRWECRRSNHSVAALGSPKRSSTAPICRQAATHDLSLSRGNGSAY